MFTRVSLFFLLSCNVIYGQDIIELTFTALNKQVNVPLDSVLIRNLSRQCDTTLFWPDTVLVLSFVGIQEHEEDLGFYVDDPYPNPVLDKTSFGIFLLADDCVSIVISDMLGRVLHRNTFDLRTGKHSFSFIPGGKGLYTISVYTENGIKSAKCISLRKRSGQSELRYDGISGLNQDAAKTYTNAFLFIPGDDLLHVGYVYGMQSGIVDAPYSSEDYIFQFATNIPCPGTPTVNYEGQVYNTVQIGSQCWLKENLNVGTMISSSQDMGNNGIIEKYCFSNNADSCETLGGYYHWEEAMAYDFSPGSRGICPPGWHIPTDNDWKILEGISDAQYPIGDPEWDLEGDRGFDAGSMLKSSSGWIYYGAGSNKTGFTAIGAGMCNMFGSFTNYQRHGYHWSSSEYSDWIWTRNFHIYGNGVDRRRDKSYFGFSVRCLKDQ